MEVVLMLSQTVFYLVASAAIIVLGVLCAMISFHLVRIARELEAISRDFRNLSDEAQERIRAVIERLSNLPILSYFLKDRSAPAEGGQGRKGRKTAHTKQL